ncbi:hypothetical protein DFH06DRAFT_1005650 [Mycena polygramma]|nr:hypothetical protein DFH06DRAFT_1005650 [Mycena polygramma]
MALPSYVSERFHLFNRNTSDETEWYGPVNTLLGYLFPPQQYEVAPQCKGQLYPGSLDSTTIYVVRAISGNRRTKHPVCFVEIKPAGHLHVLGARADADAQMRETFRDFVEELVIPKLIGFSVIGSRFAVYEYDRASKGLKPTRKPGDPTTISDIAPAACWADDFLDAADGEAKLLQVAQFIQNLCAGGVV